MLETFRNSQVLLAFFALSNVDVIVARNVLADARRRPLRRRPDPHQGGAVPAAVRRRGGVPVDVDDRGATPGADREPGAGRRHRCRSCTLGAAVLPRLALVFVGGADYAEISDSLAVFAVLGTVLSMLQLLVYSVLARQAHRSVLLVWLALVVAGRPRPARLVARASC